MTEFFVMNDFRLTVRGLQGTGGLGKKQVRHLRLRFSSREARAKTKQKMPKSPRRFRPLRKIQSFHYEN